MSTIDQLAELFARFPGIGPRQAKRFVFFLLRTNSALRKDLAKKILELDSHIGQCIRCFRYVATNSLTEKTCKLCASAVRDDTIVTIVAKDVDVDSIEKAGTYNGRYFVLGGTIPLSNGATNLIREKELKNRIDTERDSLQEILFALSATPDGEHTTTHLIEYLRPLTENTRIKITILGRGLSTGSELEYADPNTIQSALKNRK